MAIRVAGPHEQGRFEPDAWGHLIWLAGSGILSSSDLEFVIERALSLHDGRVSLGDVRALLDGAGVWEGGSGDSEPSTIH
ncbi:MAG TPA: DUF494 family protein [Gemmatimonadales bacterium]|nr:DUF494 family protein [Gemmatimonadales bacterium]